MNPYTTVELKNDLSRAGARLSMRTLGTAKFMLLERAKLVSGQIVVTTFVNSNILMTPDQKFTWCLSNIAGLIKTNPADTVVPITIS